MANSSAASATPDGYDYDAMVHGTDERILVSVLHSVVRVMDRFLAEST